VFWFLVIVSTLLLSVDPDFGFLRHLTDADLSPRIGGSTIVDAAGVTQGLRWPAAML
jgi:hypothetical protein